MVLEQAAHARPAVGRRERVRRCRGSATAVDQGVPADVMLPVVPGVLVQWSTHPASLKGVTGWWWSRQACAPCAGQAAGGAPLAVSAASSADQRRSLQMPPVVSSCS